MMTLLGQRNRGHRQVAASGGGSFVPSDLGSTLKVWLEADYGVYTDAGSTLATNGQSVQQWNDRSGNGNHFTQATSGSRPTLVTSSLNGLPILSFAKASAQRLANATNFPAPFTTFILASYAPGSFSSLRVLGGNANNWLLGWWNGGKRQAYFNGSVKLDGSPSAGQPEWLLYTGTSDGSTTASLYENATTAAIATASGAFDGPNGLVVGGDNAFSEYSTCYAYAVLHCDTVLSQANWVAVANYLNAKVAIF